ncbi:caspase family protein [bacterium]|nr:caspase family protein [bacterium]
MKSQSIFKQTSAICALIMIIATTNGLAADEPTLTIDNIEGTSGVIKIHYITTGKSDERLVTTGWQYSIDDGKTWLYIDEAAIGNNEPKPPGSSYITWDTEQGANNLAGISPTRVSMRMMVNVLGTKTWHSVESMSKARSWLAADEANGKIYAIGGKNSSGYLNTVEEYNPSTNSWRTVADMPTARGYLAATEANGKIYAIGGYGGSRTMEEYNPSTNSWRTVADMLTARTELAAAEANGKIYAIGGYSDGQCLNTVEEYNPSTNSWRTVADMLTARIGLAAVGANGRIYAIGGYSFSNSYLNTVEEYNPSTNSWRTVADMPTAKGYLAATEANGKIYAIGGKNSSGYLNTVEEYNPSANSWRTVVEMPTARSRLAIIKGNGTIYAIGGENSNGYLDIVERYAFPRKSKPVSSSSFIVANHIIAAITSPTPDSHLRGTVSINGTASVKDAQLQSWILDFAKGGNPKAGYVPLKVAQQTANNTQLTTWDTTKQNDGIYTLRLRVTNTNAMREETAVVVTVDNTPPNPPIVEIKPIGNLGDYAQSEGKLAVSGMTEAEIKTARLLDQNNRSLNDVTSHIKISEAGAITGEVPIGTLSNHVSGLKVQFVITDQAGNEAQAESNVVPVDNVMPEIKLTSPVDGAYFNTPPIVISGTASDEQTGIAKVEINTSGEWVLVDNVAGNWSYTYTPPIVDVLLNFQACAYDRAGNQRETPKITVNYLSAMPTANISSPADGDEVGGAFNVIGSVDDIDTDYSDFSWTLEYARGSNASSGFQVIREGRSPVRNSILADASLPKGACTLRLTVKNSIGSVEIKRRNINVMEEGAVALANRATNEPAARSTVQRTFPLLKIENVRLDEPSGNQALDADETGKISFQISNSGKGTATKVQVKLTSDVRELNPRTNGGLSYKQSQTIPNIAPNSSQTVEIPISATDAVAAAQVKIKVEVLEGGVGADAEPVILAFETRELKPPQLKLASSAIDDDELGESQGNANGKIEPGEQIEVDVIIQNVGVGDAENVLAQVSVPPNVVYASQSPRFDLGRIESGKWQKLHFSIWVNKRYSDEEIPLGIYLKEKRERFSLSETLSLPLNKKIESPEIVAFTAQDETEATIETAPSLQVDVDVNIPETSMNNPDAIAVVIGNRDYVHGNVPKVAYAIRDATVMRDYLIKTFGFKEGNILFYENATQAQFNSLFGTEKDYKGRLFDLVKPEKSDVFIYYSGHGAPDIKSEQGYFVPVDCDPRRVNLNGYSLNLFYQNVSKIAANSFTIVIDACFSGISHGGSLLGNISPIFPTVENPMMLLPNATVMTAARNDEVSGWYPEKRHGLFTYFFLKGISGDADVDGNGEVTVAELKQFLTDETEGVPYWARRLHSKEQHPDVFGGEGRVIVKY